MNPRLRPMGFDSSADGIGWALDMEAVLNTEQLAPKPEPNKLEPPYPGCPAKEDCIRRGYCKRDPNCGE